MQGVLRRSIKLILLLAALLLAVLTPAYSEEGCPHGSFPQQLDGKCTKVSSDSRLPLTLDAPMRFEALQVGTTTWLQATGTITKDTPGQLKTFLRSDDATLVHAINLSSGGGNLMAGLELGRIIRRSGMSTSVGRSIPLDGIMNIYTYKGTVCASACAYAFLGGVTRSYGSEDLYGLHRFGSADGTVTGDEAQIVTSWIADYVEMMGVDVAMLKLASSASFDNDIYPVPVDVAKRLRIIFDPSGITEFVVERRGGRTIAGFDLRNREQSYRGFIVCNNNTPVIVLTDPRGSIPTPLKAAVDFPVVFKSDVGLLRGTATYAAPSRSQPIPALIFRVPGLTAILFQGQGLSLQDFQNPLLPTIEKKSDGSPVVDDALMQRFAWLDAEQAFSFNILAPNATQTLPIVLENCGMHRTR